MMGTPSLQVNRSDEGGDEALESLLDDALLGFDQSECRPSGIDAEDDDNMEKDNRTETGSTASTTTRQGGSVGRTVGLGSNLKFDPLRGSKGGRKTQTPKDMEEDEKKAADGLEHLLQELSMEAGSLPDGTMRDTLAALAATGPGREAVCTDDVDDDENDDEEDDPLSSALVESIMRQLLSKDVLYEPMKEIGEQYPPWLSKNKDALEPDEYGRYEKQYVYVQKICGLYENDPDNYSGLMCLLQEMQQCGQPPQEIIDQVGPPGDFAAVSGAFGSQPQECPMM